MNQWRHLDSSDLFGYDGENNGHAFTRLGIDQHHRNFNMTPWSRACLLLAQVLLEDRENFPIMIVTIAPVHGLCDGYYA